MANYLDAEPRLLALLEPLKASAGLRAVLTAKDLAGVKAAGQTAPAVHVIYWGDALKTVSSPKESDIVLNWLTVLVVQTKTQHDRVGEQIQAIIDAVQGQLINPAHAAAGVKFKRVSSPARPVHTGGFSYYPLAWSQSKKQIGG